VIASLLDTLLDRTVVAGYAHVGYRLRRRMWHADLRPASGEAAHGPTGYARTRRARMTRSSALGAAAEPGASSGRFRHDRQRRPAHRVPRLIDVAERRADVAVYELPV
jgi:hypothetical protein